MRPSVIEIPKCFGNRKDCFAYIDNRWACLSSTDFRNRKQCPFFKNRKTVENERKMDLERQKIGVLEKCARQ